MSRPAAKEPHSRPTGKPVSEPQTIILCAKQKDPFARVPKKLLNDPKLSGLAKWILSYIISKPSGWRVRLKDICNHCADGPSAIRVRLKELRAAGYVKLVQVRTPGQRIKEWVWQASDSPIFKPVIPDSDFPHVEFQHISKNNPKINGNVSRVIKIQQDQNAPLDREATHPLHCACKECRDRRAANPISF